MLIIISTYCAILFFLLPHAIHNLAIWFGRLSSALFVVCYSLIAGGRIKTSIFIVFIFSLVVPDITFIAIGLPVYLSVFRSVNSLFIITLKQQLEIFEKLFPFLAALFGGILTSIVRKNALCK